LTLEDGVKTVLSWYRIKWQVGRTYAIQPGTGKKGVGHFKLLDIREEWVQLISLDDVYAEGVGVWLDGKLHQIMAIEVAREHFARLWNDIWKRRPEVQWEANPPVWALTIEVVDVQD
jgi:hypothetical protein